MSCCKFGLPGFEMKSTDSRNQSPSISLVPPPSYHPRLLRGNRLEQSFLLAGRRSRLWPPCGRPRAQCCDISRGKIQPSKTKNMVIIKLTQILALYLALAVEVWSWEDQNHGCIKLLIDLQPWLGGVSISGWNLHTMEFRSGSFFSLNNCGHSKTEMIFMLTKCDKRMNLKPTDVDRGLRTIK